MNFRNLLRRFSVYGDFWPKFMTSGARHSPWYIEAPLMLFWTIIFWMVCHPTREAVTSNLCAIFPHYPKWVNRLLSFRVFWNFAWSMSDRIHVREEKPIISWDIVGRQCLIDLENEQGAILLTAHMGNYDVAAPVFAHHFSQPIHIVRAPERQKENQEFQKNQLDRKLSDNFVVHYNEAGNMLGLELAKAISEGGVVAIQGDRVLFDVAPIQVSFDDNYDWNVPVGPFTLALVSRSRIHPVFIIREGYRRYRVEAFPAFEVKVQNRNKVEAQQAAARAWTDVIRPIIKRYWFQWFVFEPVFQLKCKKPHG